MILKHRNMKLFIVVSLLNLLLNPAMNIGLSYINDKTIYWIVLSISEVTTTLIESLVIYLVMRFKYLRVLLFAFIANATSFVIGLSLSFLYQTKIAAIIVSSLLFGVYLFTYGFILLTMLINKRNSQNDGEDNQTNYPKGN